MKYFFASLRYLKPYRLRLALSIVMVLFIAMLWGGGLGMLLPGMKVLISDEGLHGWAWDSMTQDRINAKLVRRTVLSEKPIDGHHLPHVLDVVSVESDGRAAEAGIGENEWLVGYVDADGNKHYLRADLLARKLALWEAPSRIVSLLVCQPDTVQVRRALIKLHRLGRGSWLLGEVAQRIPEPESKADRISILIWLLGIVLVMVIVRNFLRFVQEYLVQTAVLEGMWDLREECYNVALRQPITFFAKEGTTNTMSRFVQDSTELGRAQNTLFGKTMVEPAKAIVSIAIAFFLFWKLTLIAVIAGPFAAWAIRQFGKAMRRSTKRALESWADMLAVLEETLTGIRVVKSYTMEAAERKRFHRVNRQLFKQQRRMARTDAATSPAVEAMGMIAGLLAVGGAGYLVFRGDIDPDRFITWMVMLVAAFDPVRKLSKVVTRFQRGDAAAERLFEIRDRQREPRIPGAISLPVLKNHIIFRDVDYRYPGADDLMLHGINLSITAGQHVAIVGPNGSGKTTLVSLLPRLLEATKGTIEIDGQDIARCSLRSLRRQIGIVTQETVIFNATIAENISYGRRRAKQSEILAAAKKAFVDEFVREMPDGYDTMVGQRGATLSGGQRQRIAIARAILRDPAILIFDEALSQIDSDSEQKIQQATEKFIRDRTTLRIAHRFSTVRSANIIVVMNEGRIVDIGTHDELLERCGLYLHLYETQFAGGNPPAS